MGRDVDRKRPSIRPGWLNPLGLFLAALLLRAGTLVLRPFNGLYGQDPYFYDGLARDLWAAAVGGGPLPRTPWPVGYPLMVAAALPLTGFASSAGQWVSLAAGAVMAPLVYLLAYELLVSKDRPGAEARRTGLVAGALTAVSGQLLQSSVVAMSDAPALCWVTLSAWALARYARRPRAVWLAAAGFGLTWGAITRWEYVLLALPFAAFAVRRLRGRQRWRHWAAALLVGLLILAPQLLLLSRRPLTVRSDGWSLRNAVRSEFVTGAGFDRYTWPTGLFYVKPIVSPGYLLPLFTPALVLGAVVTLRRRWWDVTLLLGGWGAVMYAALAGLPFQSFRYALAYLPPVMILTALGLRRAVAGMGRRWRGVARGVVALGIAATAGWGGYRTDQLIRAWQADKAVVRWALGQLPADATLLSHGLTLIAQHESSLEILDLYEVTPDDLKALTSDGRPDYVLVDPQFVEEQWAGRAPSENLRWLRDGPGLERLAARGRYTLFQVRRFRR